MWQATEYCSIRPVIRKSTAKVCTWRNRALHGAFERLELYAWKQARTVLRGRGDSNAALLPDYRILVHPVLLAKGRSLLKDGAERVNLDLVDTTALGGGVTILTYQPVR